jgi:L-ornithine N5-oxygenase
MPRMIRELADSLGLDHIEVDRNYRLRIDGEKTLPCYLQGVNEATHGIADSLLSVLATRSSDITHDLLAEYEATATAAEPSGRTGHDPGEAAGEQVLASLPGTTS